MNNVQQRMPIHMARIIKKLNIVSNSVIRDFSEITHIRQRKGFSKAMLKKLSKSLEEDPGVFWFDGFDNFTSSIHLFSLVWFYNGDWIILEPLIQNVYWVHNDVFFVNDLNPHVLGFDYEITTDVVPLSLGISWNKSHYISKITYTRNHSTLIINNTDDESYNDNILEYYLNEQFLTQKE
jgi:hypothetical protein